MASTNTQSLQNPEGPLLAPNLPHKIPASAAQLEQPQIAPLSVSSEIFTSMCDSLKSITSTSNVVSSEISPTVVIVSSSQPAKSSDGISAVLVPASSSTTNSTGGAVGMKLVDLVSNERGNLFSENAATLDGEYELEPHRESILAVRRRSIKFFTLMEEEEDETENKKTPEAAGSQNTVPSRQSVFHLGESLRKLYYPNSRVRRSTNRKAPADKDTNSATGASGYESDPEPGSNLYERVTSSFGLRRIQSHPEISEFQDMTEKKEDYNYGSMSKSLPTTPKMSPKFIRKASSKTEVSESENKGPGYSFLSLVAGELRAKKAKAEKESALTKRFDGSVIKYKGTESEMGRPRSSPPEVTQRKDAKETANREGSDNRAEGLPAENGNQREKKSVLQSLISWSTTTSVSVSNKETNFFSPSSF